MPLKDQRRIRSKPQRPIIATRTVLTGERATGRRVGAGDDGQIGPIREIRAGLNLITLSHRAIQLEGKICSDALGVGKEHRFRSSADRVGLQDDAVIADHDPGVCSERETLKRFSGLRVTWLPGDAVG